MIGAVGEVVGAAGVILSLLYLARQIRGASLRDQRTRYDQAIDTAITWNQSLATEGDLAEVFVRGMLGDTTDLKPEERLRFYASLLTVFRTYERVSQYGAEGGVHAWGRESFAVSFRDLMAAPGVQAYWAKRRHWFGPQMQVEVDDMVAEAGHAFLDTYMEGGGSDSPVGAL
jgi:hypothetical protein